VALDLSFTVSFGQQPGYQQQVAWGRVLVVSEQVEAGLNEAELRDGEKRISMTRVTHAGDEPLDDVVSVEEPLEIRVVFGPENRRRSKSLSITMRTPGNDIELAAGVLLSENIIKRPDQLLSFEYVGPTSKDGNHRNTLTVELRHDVPVEIEKLQRHFYTTSSCGVCGKASLDAVRNLGMRQLGDSMVIDRNIIFRLPEGLREHQEIFERTGGLHAAGLTNDRGEFIAIRENVGRHNAVDKLIGSQMIQAKSSDSGFPISRSVLVVSGRASFELVQKALMAQIPMLVAVGAPSSLAVELVKEFNMTLIGFTSTDRFNIYSGRDRIQ